MLSCICSLALPRPWGGGGARGGGTVYIGVLSVSMTDPRGLFGRVASSLADANGEVERGIRLQDKVRV